MRQVFRLLFQPHIDKPKQPAAEEVVVETTQEPDEHEPDEKRPDKRKRKSAA